MVNGRRAAYASAEQLFSFLLFDILHLFTDLFDFTLDIDNLMRQNGVLHLRANRICLSVHLLNNEIELSADSDELKKYLHGEEFETACENGWAVVTVEGCSVGGVKVVSGRAKNHYPKGLRTK